MGYFRTRISRQRCALQVARAVARQGRADLSAWLEAPPGPPRPAARLTYLRFAVGQVHSDSREPMGVFHACRELRLSRPLPRRHFRRMVEALTWFSDNLVAPDLDCAGAVFWFRSDAGPCLRQIWELIRVLRAYDHLVWMVRTEMPGMIVYRDELQVAAVPCPSRVFRSRPVSGGPIAR